MGFEFREKLTPGEKKRRAAEYTKWLQENGFLPDYSNSLLEAQRLIDLVIQELDKGDTIAKAMSKLASNAQEKLSTIKL